MVGSIAKLNLATVLVVIVVVVVGLVV